MDNSTEDHLVFDNGMKAAKIGTRLQKLEQLIIKDRSVTFIPTNMASFLKEQMDSNL